MNEMETEREREREWGESKLLFLIHTTPSPHLTIDVILVRK